MKPSTKLLRLLSAALLLGMLSGHAAFAQNGAKSNAKDPLEVSADGTLEWLREDRKFVATKNALARQGTSSVAGEKLTALYREGKSASNIDIYEVTAQQNVVLRSRDTAVFGQNAVYNLDQELATVTGDNLKMTAPDQTVTARDKFEYWTAEGRFNAIGNAQIIRPKPGGGTDTLKADKITAILKENKEGKQVLHTLEAFGNVVITTPAETITGAYGIYKAATNKAELTGGVKILRGPNTLEGERASVDMNTNISTIFAAEKTTAPGTSDVRPGGRVRGIFYPGSEAKP